MGAELLHHGGDAGYLSAYRRVIAHRGPCFEALLWRNPESQTERFRVIAETVALPGRVIADLGCGRADFPVWMAAEGIEWGRYIGVDALEEMIACSRERAAGHGLIDAEFMCADFAADAGLPERLVRERGVDTLVFSGSLNTFEEARAGAVLERAWRAIARIPGGVLVFNFLSDRDREPPASPEGPARRFDTVGLVRWALERTMRVALRHDYLEGRDATIAMWAGD